MTAAPKRKPAAARPRAPDPSGARIDGRNLRFEVVADGRAVACAISQHALRDMTAGGKHIVPGDLLACFAKLRPRVEALAMRRIRARRVMPQGVFYIWPEDEDAEPRAPSETTREREG